MPLNEDQIKEMATRVGQVDPNDPVALEFIANSLAAQQADLKRLQANWRLQRYLGNHKMMTELDELVQKARQVLAALERWPLDS